MVFPCGKIRPIRAFKLLRESSPSPSGWGPCIRPLFLGRNCEMSFHALSCFRSKTMKPPCVTGEDVTNKVVTVDSTSFHQLWGNVYFAEFVAAASEKKKSSHSLRDNSGSYSSLCCRFSDMCRFSLMSSTVVVLFLCIRAVRGLTLRGWLEKSLFHLSSTSPSVWQRHSPLTRLHIQTEIVRGVPP